MNQTKQDLIIQGPPRLRSITKKYVDDMSSALDAYAQLLNHPDMTDDDEGYLEQLESLLLAGRGHAVAQTMSLLGILNWSVRVAPKEARAIARAHDRLNDCLLGIIIAANEMIPNAYYKPDNPNNGCVRHEFEIGLEYSPVLYLHIHKNNYLQMSGDEWGSLGIELLRLGHKFGADEFNIQENNDWTLTVRYWFD